MGRYVLLLLVSKEGKESNVRRDLAVPPDDPQKLSGRRIAWDLVASTWLAGVESPVDLHNDWDAVWFLDATLLCLCLPLHQPVPPEINMEPPSVVSLFVFLRHRVACRPFREGTGFFSLRKLTFFSFRGFTMSTTSVLEQTADAADPMVKWFDVPPSIHGNNDIHVVVRLKHRTDIRRNIISIQVKKRRTKEALRKFRTIPTFLKAFVHADRRFQTKEFMDKNRKQWGYDCQLKAGTAPTKNPRIHEQSCGTPPEVYEFLHKEWNLTLADYDPCPLNYTVCGLTNKWPKQKASETVYVNPPYRDCERWVKKTLHELRRGRISSAAMLLPARLYPQWFHKYVIPYASQITAADGGIRFVGYDRVYPWGNILVLFLGGSVRVCHANIRRGLDIPNLCHLNSYRFHPARPRKSASRTAAALSKTETKKKKKKKKTKKAKKRKHHQTSGWCNQPSRPGLP
jgi:hypothetical protein